MSFAFYDDRLPNNKKVAWLVAQGVNGVAALGLHLLANTWSRHEGMRGFVPDYMPERLVGRCAKKLVTLLVEVGMFDAADGGWTIHDYSQFGRDDGTPVAAKVNQLSQQRAEAGRKGGLAKAGKTASNIPSKPPSNDVATSEQTSSPKPLPLPVSDSPLSEERPETLRAVTDSAHTQNGKCSRHPAGNPTGEPCGGCKALSERDRRKDDRDAEITRLDVERRSRSCRRCDGAHVIDDEGKPTKRKCDHGALSSVAGDTA